MAASVTLPPKSLYPAGTFVENVKLKVMIRGILISVAAVFLASCGHSDKVKQEEPMPVKVCRVGHSNAESVREFSFITKPFKVTDLSFRVGGPVSQLDAHPGKFYKRGAVIATIDGRDFKIRKDRAEAISHQASSEFKRIATLYERNSISGSNYEKAKADLAVAKAAFNAAANDYGDTQIRAPFDGYVQTVNVERYQDVRPSQAVVTFIELSKLKVEAYIPEDIAIRASSVNHVSLQFDAASDKRITAPILDISKSAMSNNISYLLTASLENSGQSSRLLGGMTGTLTLELPRQTQSTSISIPQKAVCNRPSKGSYVWVVNTASRQVKSACIELGKLSESGMIEVRTGLKGNEVLVLTGLTSMVEGKRITIKE